nr:MAG TPA: hypothetical protein [Caudoviricetes sp.]
MKGGARPGAGRPKGREFPARVQITMTSEQKEKLLALGGSSWVRKELGEKGSMTLEEKLVKEYGALASPEAINVNTWKAGWNDDNYDENNDKIFDLCEKSLATRAVVRAYQDLFCRSLTAMSRAKCKAELIVAFGYVMIGLRSIDMNMRELPERPLTADEESVRQALILLYGKHVYLAKTDYKEALKRLRIRSVTSL